jgi:hypothetical protein
MNFDPIIAFILTVSPIVQTVLTVLGSLVVIGTGIDAAIPDEKDGGFMTKILSIPIVGDFLKAITRFSPFNVK